MKKVIFEVKDRPLPKPLIDSMDFEGLTESEVRIFEARLRRYEEVRQKLLEWVESGEKLEEFSTFLNRLELDLGLIFSFPSENQPKGVSWWLIHSSWIFDTDAARMESAKSVEILRSRKLVANRSQIEPENFFDILKNDVRCVSELQEAFYLSDSYDEAIAALICLDIVFSDTLNLMMNQRINLNIESKPRQDRA